MYQLIGHNFFWVYSTHSPANYNYLETKLMFAVHRLMRWRILNKKLCLLTFWQNIFGTKSLWAYRPVIYKVLLVSRQVEGKLSRSISWWTHLYRDHEYEEKYMEIKNTEEKSSWRAQLKKAKPQRHIKFGFVRQVEGKSSWGKSKANWVENSKMLTCYK